MIGIVNYGAGNIYSLTAALNRLNLKWGIINTADELAYYSHIIIPGVGHAGTAMKKLKTTHLDTAIKNLTQPVLGICVGMQLLNKFSEEGNSELMNIIPLKTRLFNKENGFKIPHTGWNKINKNESLLFHNILNEAYFYFVHSYFTEINSQYTIATAQHGDKFSAAVQLNNFYGVQFHPEKSGVAGEQLLINFSKIKSCI